MEEISRWASICPRCHCSTGASKEPQVESWAGAILGAILGVIVGAFIGGLWWLGLGIVGYIIGFALACSKAPKPKTRDGG
jgi:hypothetical protein